MRRRRSGAEARRRLRRIRHRQALAIWRPFFGLAPAAADGVDYFRALAAHTQDKPIDAVTKADRRAAKLMVIGRGIEAQRSAAGPWPVTSGFYEVGHLHAVAFEREMAFLKASADLFNAHMCAVRELGDQAAQALNRVVRAKIGG